ncbi:MAG: methyltransferase family protein [Candidatus Hermodarchaeota archaeon]
MKLKGLDKFLDKIPKFSGKKILFLPIYVIVVLILSLMVQIYFDILPSLLPVNGPLEYFTTMFPVLGVTIIGVIAIILVYQMWSQRERLRAKYGQLSYQRIFLAGFAGVVLLFSIVVNNFIAFYQWNPVFWTQFPFSIFATPLTSFISPISLLFGYIRFFLGVLLCILGAATMGRAILTFGFDYMTVTYLYFPEESELQDHQIYSVLRHPAYSGILIVCLGGTIIQFTIYSILCFLILYFGMFIHIHFVEEKELIIRFGNSYVEYRRKTPAFFAHIRDWGSFFRFILGGE